MHIFTTFRSKGLYPLIPKRPTYNCYMCVRHIVLLFFLYIVLNLLLAFDIFDIVCDGIMSVGYLSQIRCSIGIVWHLVDSRWTLIRKQWLVVEVLHSKNDILFFFCGCNYNLYKHGLHTVWTQTAKPRALHLVDLDQFCMSCHLFPEIARIAVAVSSYWRKCR